VALMLFGAAKIVEQRHRNLLAMSAGTIAMNGFRGDDATRNWMPLDDVGSLALQGIVPMDLGCTQIHALDP
jgi:microcystin synthetase protein McyG